MPPVPCAMFSKMGITFFQDAWSHRSVSTTVAPTYYQPANPDRAQYQPVNPDRGQYQPVNRPLYEPDPDIYEPIYDSRWRLLNQASNIRHIAVVSYGPFLSSLCLFLQLS